MAVKAFVGPRVRALRVKRGLNLATCAAQLGVSVSYLSQIEANQRPVTARVLMALVDLFEVEAAAFDADDDQRLMADLRSAVAESGSGRDPVGLSEIRQLALHAPAVARRFLELHRANQRLTERLSLTDAAIALDERTAASSLLPYEEVRDFIHDHDNYIDGLDHAAEALAEEIGVRGAGAVDELLAAFLRERLDVTVRLGASDDDLMRRFEPQTRTLWLNARQAPTTRSFQMAFQIVRLRLAGAIEEELASTRFRTREAVELGRIALGNYAAAALQMPYRRFAGAARSERHDVDRLAFSFDASLEQVCHRLSTLQRPGERGVSLYFVRLDLAGNITKRHSATRLRFARFGGACPLWNVHNSLAATDRFDVQLAEMPDGVRYLCVARSIVKPSLSYLAPQRRYVLGFGCEISDAGELVYSEGVDLQGPATPIGVSCRICERDSCAQRAFPPVDRGLSVPPDERRIVPYTLQER